MTDAIFAVDNGMAITANRLMGAGTEPKNIGWGVGVTAALAINTTLETPSAEARTAGTSNRVTTNTANDTYQVVGLITCTEAAKAITEVGLFDDIVAGSLFLRGTFSPINVNVGDSIQFTAKNILNQL